MFGATFSHAIYTEVNKVPTGSNERAPQADGAKRLIQQRSQATASSTLPAHSTHTVSSAVSSFYAAIPSVHK